MGPSIDLFLYDAKMSDIQTIFKKGQTKMKNEVIDFLSEETEIFSEVYSGIVGVNKKGEVFQDGKKIDTLDKYKASALLEELLILNY